MEAYADELREVSVGTEGNVVVVSGLTSTITGDTLTTHTPSSQADADQVSLMPIVQIPDPVYFCSLEAHSPSQQQALEDALAIIQKEDPSLKVSMEADMGQLVVSGMGKTTSKKFNTLKNNKSDMTLFKYLFNRCSIF